MIHCVRFVDVVAFLERGGFAEAGRTEASCIFRHPDGRQVIVRRPNVDGHVPEILVDDAFDAAGLPPPRWDVFWCD